MALSTTRVHGVRHVVNGSEPNPEEESQGLRSDWAAELFGTVSTIEDLPTSGNWVGRQRWVTSLGMKVEWNGDRWVTVKAPEIYYFAKAATGYSTTNTSDHDMPHFNQVMESYGGITTSGSNSYNLPYPGRYQVTFQTLCNGVTGSGLSFAVRKLWELTYDVRVRATLGNTSGSVMAANGTVEVDVPTGADARIVLRKIGTSVFTLVSDSWISIRYMGLV